MAYLLNFMGFVFLSLRNIFPDFISIVLANVLIVLCVTMIARGLVSFTGGRQNVWMDLLAPLVLALGFWGFIYLSPNLKMRIFILSFILTGIILRCISINRKQVSRLLGKENRFLSAAFIWVIVSLLFRAVFTLSSAGQMDDFMQNSTIQGISMMTGSIGLIFIALGLVIINAQRLEKDLIQAGKEIKTLQGFLPICAHCKKIRDDKGYWNQIESYLNAHSEVTFSHGICDECLKKYYPEYCRPLDKLKRQP